MKKKINPDKENIAKAVDSANFLLNDLKGLVYSKNSYLSDIALELMEVVVKVEHRLKRIKSYKE
jgi:hypothetical protein